MNSLSHLGFALAPPPGHALLPPCYHGYHRHVHVPHMHAPHVHTPHVNALLDPEPAFVQRRNERERERVRHVNQGYARLRQILPKTGPEPEPRLSKVQTLRAAIRYISDLQRLLQHQQHKHQQQQNHQHQQGEPQRPAHL